MSLPWMTKKSPRPLANGQGGNLLKQMKGWNSEAAAWELVGAS